MVSHDREQRSEDCRAVHDHEKYFYFLFFLKKKGLFAPEAPNWRAISSNAPTMGPGGFPTRPAMHTTKQIDPFSTSLIG